MSDTPPLPLVTVLPAGVAVGLALACGGGTPPTGWVVTARYPGVAPEDVEQQLLTPLESALAGAGGEQLQGVAEEGVAKVVVHLDGEDPAPLMDALEAVQPALPAEAELPRLRRTGKARWIVVAPESAHTAIPLLEHEVGVEAVDAHALPEEQVVVALDPDRLRAWGVRPAQVRDALAADVVLPGDAVEAGRVIVRTTPHPLEATESLADLVVAMSDTGVPVRLGDLATVSREVAEGPHAWSGGESVTLLEVASDRTDLAGVVGGRALDGLTRVSVRATGPGWEDAFDTDPDAVVLADGAEGTVWTSQGADAARATLGAIPGVDAFVHEEPCREVVLFSDDLQTLDTAVASVRSDLALVPGVWTWSTWEPARPDLRVTVDGPRAGAVGLSEADVATAVTLAAGGMTVGEVQQDTRRLDVVLRLAGTDHLPDLDVGGVPLGAVASIEEVLVRPIPHVDGVRAATVKVCGAVDVLKIAAPEGVRLEVR